MLSVMMSATHWVPVVVVVFEVLVVVVVMAMVEVVVTVLSVVEVVPVIKAVVEVVYVYVSQTSPSPQRTVWYDQDTNAPKPEWARLGLPLREDVYDNTSIVKNIWPLRIRIVQVL